MKTRILSLLTLFAAATMSFTFAPNMSGRERSHTRAPGADDPVNHDANEDNHMAGVEPGDDRGVDLTSTPGATATPTATPDDRGRRHRGRGHR